MSEHTEDALELPRAAPEHQWLARRGRSCSAGAAVM